MVDDEDTQSGFDYAGASPLVRLLHQVFARPVERLSDVEAQLLAGPQPMQDPGRTGGMARVAQAAPAAAVGGAPALPAGVNWDFVARHEGDGRQATVPQHHNGPFPDSGVTIAHGLDLGQRDAVELRRLELSDDLVARFAPYLGLRGQAAQDYVQIHPLAITTQERDQIDRPLFTSGYNALARRYNAASRTGVRFQDLPAEAQTAIMDVAHQYGDLAVRTPNFWNQIINGRWQDAQANLTNFGDIHRTRRRHEADLMQNAINAGALPNPARPAAGAIPGD